MTLIVSPLVLPGQSLPGFEHSYSAHHEILRGMHEYNKLSESSSSPVLPSLSPLQMGFRDTIESYPQPPSLSSFMHVPRLIQVSKSRKRVSATFPLPTSDVSECEGDSSDDCSLARTSPFNFHSFSSPLPESVSLIPSRPLPNRNLSAEPIAAHREQRVGRGINYKHSSRLFPSLYQYRSSSHCILSATHLGTPMVVLLSPL